MNVNIVTAKQTTRSNLLHLLVFVIILSGIILISVITQPSCESKLTICFFKNALNIPCPGCGMTRALLFLAHGDIHSASLMNPNSIPVFFIFSMLLFNAAYRAFFKKEIVILFSGKEKMFVYIFSAIIMICGWIYNLTLNPFA